MNIISLKRRLASTIIDKMVILFLFVIVAIIFCAGEPGAELGTFTYLTSVEYNKMESEKTIYQRSMELNQFMKEQGYPVDNFTDDGYERYKTEKDVYLKYFLIFVIVNLLYYLLCELVFKSSLGKRMLKCKIQRKDGVEITKPDAFKRVGIMATLLILAFVLQRSLNLNALITSLLFFGILDFTVFTKQQSLIDKYSDTIVVKMK